MLCMALRTNSDYFPVQHWLTGFYNRDGVCLLRGTDWVFMYNSTFCPHSVFMCFVWIWEQTAIISLYSINWLVCTRQTQCVYCAVRPESPTHAVRHPAVLLDSRNQQTKNSTANHKYAAAQTEPLLCELLHVSAYFLTITRHVHKIMWQELSLIYQKIDRGSTVVKVLCYKSEGRWFDSIWCHWNFSLT